MTFEPEVVDWDAEGVHEAPATWRDGEEQCGVPFGDRPPKTCPRHWNHRCNARHMGSIARCDLRKSDCARLSTEEKAQRLGVLPDPARMTSGDMLKAIRRRHHTPPSRMPEYLVLPEFYLDAPRFEGDPGGGRRVDALAVRMWTTRGLTIHAYEVKVSRSDLLSELARPDKRQAAMDASSHFWFACPVGLMHVDEVPEGCGLIEFGRRPKGGGFMHRVIVPAPQRTLECLSPRLVFGIAWRLRDLERKLQGRGIVL